MPEFSFDGTALEDDVVPTKTGHYSHSQLDLFLRCPEAYRRKYILKEPWPANWSMTTGKAFHKSIELITVMGEEAAAQAFDSFRVDAMSEEIGDMPEDPKEAEDSLAKMFTLASKVHGDYRDKYIRGCKGMEYKFEIDVGGLNVLGFMDLVTKDGVVVDWKTGAKSLPEDAAANSRQLVLYDLAYRTLFKEAPQKLGLIWAGHLKAGPKIVERWIEPHGQESFDRLANAFKVMDQVIRNDGPWQGAAPGSWSCAADKCPAWKACGLRV